MKNARASLLLLVFLSGRIKEEKYIAIQTLPLPVNNLIIITLDGFRWQEVFHGADSVLLNDEKFTPDNNSIRLMYWSGSAEERRKKLMPFFWNVLANQGQLYGNRTLLNKADVENPYAISYPGYNEIFTGKTDLAISSNARDPNPHINVLEYLNGQPGFAGKVVAFTSWNAFPFILNKKRSHLMINSGNEISGNSDEETDTRPDQQTFLTAMDYIKKNDPRVIYLGFGENDEFGHQGRYDLYLQQANQVDQMIATLWHWVQTTPGYKDHTTLLITTDHGRGIKKNKWTSHGIQIRGSSQTWMAIMGPGILPLGEIKEDQQIYQKQLAQTIAGLVGENFNSEKAFATAIFSK